MAFIKIPNNLPLSLRYNEEKKILNTACQIAQVDDDKEIPRMTNYRQLQLELAHQQATKVDTLLNSNSLILLYEFKDNSRLEFVINPTIT